MDLLLALAANLVAAPLYLIAAAITTVIVAVAYVADRRRPPAARIGASGLTQEATALWLWISIGLIFLVLALFIAALGLEWAGQIVADPVPALALVAGLLVGLIVGRRWGVMIGYPAMWVTAMAILLLHYSLHS